MFYIPNGIIDRKPLNARALEYYMDNFDFKTMRIDSAFRYGRKEQTIIVILISNFVLYIENFAANSISKQKHSKLIVSWKHLHGGFGIAIHNAYLATLVRTIVEKRMCLILIYYNRYCLRCRLFIIVAEYRPSCRARQSCKNDTTSICTQHHVYY